jgi:hypothetical protein
MSEYFVHSGVRKRHTALKRRLAPVNAALVQHIGGLVVRRARPVPVTHAKVMQILDQLKAAEAEGRLELRTPDGRLVDLNTLAPAAPPVAPPAPNFLPDSAARDLPAGQNMPLYQEGTGIMQETEAPALIETSTEDPEPSSTGKTPALIRRKGKS